MSPRSPRHSAAPAARLGAGGRRPAGSGRLVDLAAMAGLPCSDGRGAVYDEAGDGDPTRGADDTGPTLTELAALLSVLLK